MRPLLFFILMTFCTGLAFSQTTNASYQDIIPVSTKSPDAASLGKFGDIPVGYNTGVASISIPVFKISVGRISIPLSFDYHSGGIRVDEISSSVGLGWALSGIGDLSRNVVGLPDDQGGGYLNSMPFDSLYTYWAGGGSSWSTDVQAGYYSFLVNNRNGVSETEPDIFSYSLASGGGKFVYRRDGSFFQVPKTNNVIQHYNGGYKITDPNGIVYIFDLADQVETINSGTENYHSGDWRLSKMIDPFTVDTVYFSYQSGCDVNTQNFTNYLYTFGYGPDCAASSTSGSTSNNVVQYNGEIASTSNVNHLTEYFPAQITWRGGKIVFTNACDRTDNAAEDRLSRVDIYSFAKGSYSLVKSVKLYQSYFYSNVTNTYGYTTYDPRKYRLRLDSVSELANGTNDSPAVYRMTYNTGNMAARESAGQDQFGFNNGAFTNTTLMPRQNVTWNNAIYSIGEANRDADSVSMLACTISSIQYPTKGKSVFEFEPHRYSTNVSYSVDSNMSSAANGGGTGIGYMNFTPKSSAQTFSLFYQFSSYDTGATDRPRIIIRDLTSGDSTLISSNLTPTQPLSANVPWSPIVGHNYQFYLNVYTTTNTHNTITLTLNWTTTYSNVFVNMTGGGLRVKSVTNYDNTGVFISKDIYKYGLGENGLGVLLTPASYLLVNYTTKLYRCGFKNLVDNSACVYLTGPSNAITYYANPVYPASQFNGSPVLYSEVAKYQLDASGNAVNGKSVFDYFVYQDQPAIATYDYGKVGVLMITDSWRNGILGYQYDYKYDAGSATYALVHQKVNSYLADMQETLPGLKVVSNYNWNTSQCEIQASGWAHDNFGVYQVPYYSGAMVLASASDISYGSNNVNDTITNNYTYTDTTHLFPTSKSMADSKGLLRVETMKYPHDFSSAGNVYSAMVSKNIIAPVVQRREVYNGTQMDSLKVNYSDILGNGTVLSPSSIDEQIASYPIETRLKYNKYDKYGNIVQQQKANDVFQTYLWDYQSMYPVAKCINADSASIAYTGWEAESSGGWTVPAGAGKDTGIVWFEGARSYLLNSGYTISKSGLTSSKTYVVSYWTTNSSAYSVAGTIGSATKGKTIAIGNASWTLYEHKITGVTAVTVGGAASYIDCLRLFPADAQMSSYSYKPLVGMTSECSPDNKMTYYLYDGLNRLSAIKDQDGNVIKTYEYHYKSN